MSAHDLQHVVDALGRTLLHFLWQGVLIALVLEAWLAATRHRPSGERYLARCAGLLLLCAAPAWTFALLWLRGPVGPDPIVEAVTSSAVAAEVTQTAQELGTLPLLVALWAVGVALFSLRLVGGCAELVRLRRRLVGAPLVPEWQARFDAAARRFGVQAQALVVDSAVVAVPTVIGYLKPVVLLPGRLFTGLTQDQLEALIAHELAHVARHDTLVNLAQSVVESLFFYHPAVWWISRGLRTEREFCCDDRAVVATQDGLSYARALAALEAWRGPQPQLGVSTLGGSLMQRIQRLVGAQPGRTSGASPRHAIATLAALGALGATAFGFASWTAPPAAHDCECSCHGESAERAPVRWRVVTGDDAEGQEVHEVILGTGSGASSGVGGARPHEEYRRVVLGEALALGGDVELPGGGEYRHEYRSNGGQDVDLERLERQLAELKAEIGDLARQRANLEMEYVDSTELHGHELRDLLGKVHDVHRDAGGAQGETAWIDALVEAEGDGGPRVFRVKPGAGGGNVFFEAQGGADAPHAPHGGGGWIETLIQTEGGADARVLRVKPGAGGNLFFPKVPGAEGGRVHGVELHGSKDAKGNVRFGRIATGGGSGGDVRFFAKSKDGLESVDIDVEGLHEYLAVPHGNHAFPGGSGGGAGLPHGAHIDVEVHEGEGGAFHEIRTGGGANVFHVGGGSGAGGGNVFFSDSDGDGLPDRRVHAEAPHAAHGGGGGAGGGLPGARYRRLRDAKNSVLIEKAHGAHGDGELLFDDHGVRVRQLESGVLTVETGSEDGDEVYLQLRTRYDEATGQLEIEPVIERVEGSAPAKKKPAKFRLRRSENERE